LTVFEQSIYIIHGNGKAITLLNAELPYSVALQHSQQKEYLTAINIVRKHKVVSDLMLLQTLIEESSKLEVDDNTKSDLNALLLKAQAIAEQKRIEEEERKRKEAEELKRKEEERIKAEIEEQKRQEEKRKEEERRKREEEENRKKRRRAIKERRRRTKSQS